MGGNAFTSFPFGAVGGLVELGRDTLGSPNSNMTVSSFANKRYLMVLSDVAGSNTNQNMFHRFNSDSGSNYATRQSLDGAADGTEASVTQIFSGGGGAGTDTTPDFGVYYIENLAAQEKLLQGHTIEQQAAGVGNVPGRGEITGKWDNTADALTTLLETTTTAGTYNTGSECVVLGWDPSDIHTDNFFVEEGSASGSTLDITLSTARKYIWTQFLVRAGSASTTLKLRVGNGSLDSTNLYAFRQSDDGTADTTTPTTDGITLNTNALAANELLFANIFMLNVSAREKLLIIHTTDTNTGAGASNAPSRETIVAKHVNTSNLDDHIGIVATSGSLSATSSQGKSWGGD